MKAHGTWKIKKDDSNTLLIKVNGAWNKEAAVLFSNEFKQIASTITNEPWAILISVQNAEIPIPEAMDVLQQLNEWSITNGCRCEASIVSLFAHEEVFKRTRAKKVQQQQRGEQVDAQLDYEQHIFLSLSEGIDFLAEKGIKLATPISDVKTWFSK
tara:strand:- start:652 stop:1119 length:468 start_codon:yes stop_codon:yes gene_type:complete